MKLFPRLFVRCLLLVCLTTMFTACGWVFGDKGMFRDRGDDYRKARVEPPLELPEGVASPVMEGNYAIPPISDQSKLEGDFAVPRPAPLAEEAEHESVRINKLGNQQWILVDGSPGEVWPRLRGFLNLNQIVLRRADAVTGIMETVWMQPAAEGTLKERYRLRIEQGVQRGTSEVYVLQANITAGEQQWPSSSSNPEREATMVKELSQYLADSVAVASVSMLAEQAIDSSGKVSIEQPQDGAPYLKLDLSFARAWASLGLALNKAKFTIDDLDRSQKLYYVNYVEVSDDDDGGFFNWFGGDDEEPAGVDYLIKMHDVTDESVIITIQKEGDEPLPEGEDTRLLQLIKRYLA